MKIRSGFVSNSSSSSYIVKVPKKFKITAKTLSDGALTSLTECEELEYSEEDEELTEKGLKDGIGLLNNALDELKAGRAIHRYNTEYAVFLALRDVLEDNNHVVMVSDGAGGDGEDVIMPFKDRRKAKK